MQFRAFTAIVCAATASVLGLGPAFCSSFSPARATGDSPAINGKFTAVSNGEWAQVNDAFHDKPTVRSIWTISSSCANALSCAGTVTSDQGWTASVYTTNYVWYVKRDVANWEDCPDGSSIPGHQVYRFYAVAVDGTLDPTSTTYAGKDETTGPSGACGKNLPLDISLPFKLVQIG